MYDFHIPKSKRTLTLHRKGKTATSKEGRSFNSVMVMGIRIVYVQQCHRNMGSCVKCTQNHLHVVCQTEVKKKYIIL